MGQHSTPRHRKTVTRDDLLHRHANVCGFTYGESVDMNQPRSDEQLRERVEELEQLAVGIGLRQEGRRRSFARSQPTTSLDGLTR